jgi:hypothetical protein
MSPIDPLVSIQDRPSFQLVPHFGKAAKICNVPSGQFFLVASRRSRLTMWPGQPTGRRRLRHGSADNCLQCRHLSRCGLERRVFEDSWTILHELNPLVEGCAGDHVGHDVGVAVVDTF